MNTLIEEPGVGETLSVTLLSKTMDTVGSYLIYLSDGDIQWLYAAIEYLKDKLEVRGKEEHIIELSEDGEMDEKYIVTEFIFPLIEEIIKSSGIGPPDNDSLKFNN